MFCGNCGTNIEDNAVFCPNCGARVEPSYNEESNTQQNTFENNTPVMPVQNDVIMPEPVASEVPMPEPVQMPEPVPMQNEVNMPGEVNMPESMPEPMPNEVNMPGQVDFENQPENQNFGTAPMYGQGDMNNWNNNMAPNFNVDEKPKKKFPKKLLFIGLPVVLVVALIICNLSSVVGFCVKTFGSDSDYLRYTEVNDLKKYCDSASTIYDAYFLENVDMKVGQTGEIAFELSNEGITMLEELAGDSMDFEWLKDVKINMESNMDGNQNVKADLKIAGTDIVSFDMVNDLENSIVYIAVPELCEKYLGVELATDDMTAAMEVTEGLEKILPSEKELNKLMKKYLKIAFDSVKDAEMSKDTLEAGDLSKKCTTVEIQIDQRLVSEMALNILEEVQNDKEIQKIVTDFVALMAETDPAYEDIDVDTIFTDEIEATKETITESLDELDEDDDGEVLATLVDYIDGNHEIIGRAILVDDEEVAKYAMITKGGKFAFELTVEESASVIGSGKKTSSTITGDFEVVADEQEVLTFSIDKFNTKKLENGELEGTIRIGIGSVAEAILGSSGEIAAFLDYTLEMVFDTTAKGGTASIALLDGEDKLLSITSKSSMKNPSKVSVPDSAKVIEVEEGDTEAMMEYVEEMDITTIINNLDEAGVPDEIIDAVENAIETMGSTSSMDDYSDFDYEDYADIGL